MAYNKSQKLHDNIAAIKLVLQLSKEGRAANDAERVVLRRYSGFGGLKFILNPATSDEDKQFWKNSDMQYFSSVRELYGIIHEYAADEKEERAIVDSVKRSVNTAFYTPSAVIDAIAAVFKARGVAVNTLLDPSAGIGKFGDSFKQAYGGHINVTAFEKDLLTGKILEALHPSDRVTVNGFETISHQLQGTFDLATSNIPFGDIRVMDDEYRRSKNDAKRYSVSTIHNYFFLKALDQVREGGFVAFITSRGFMDSPSNNPIRQEIVKNARLVGAFRLPDGMFRDEAGTDVGSDLVVLQKVTGYDRSLDPYTQAFCETTKGFSSTDGDDFTDITMNTYWWQSMLVPDGESIVSTSMVRGTDPYGKPTLVFPHDGGIEGIAKQLKAYFGRKLQKEYVDYYMEYAPKQDAAVVEQPSTVVAAVQQAPVEQPVQPERQPSQGRAQDRTSGNSGQQVHSAPIQLDLFSLWDALDAGNDASAEASQAQDAERAAQEAARREAERQRLAPRPWVGVHKEWYRDGIVVVEPNTNYVGVLTGNTFTPLANVTADQTGCLRQYVLVRDAYHELYDREAEVREEQPDLREELNRHYDNFFLRYGRLNERKNARLIMMDALGRDSLALENGEGRDFVKADIFVRPVSFISYEVTHVDTPEEALNASLNRFGHVDLDYMAGLTDNRKDELQELLKGQIYLMPDGNYELASKALSGNIYEKLEFVSSSIAALDNAPGSWTREQLDALKDTKTALEATVPEQIAFDDIGLQFGERWIPVEYYEEYISRLFDTKIEIQYAEHADEYSLKAENRWSLKIREEFCVRGEYKTYDGMDLLAHAFHNTTPDIQKCIGSDANGDDLKGPDMEKIQLANTKIEEIRDGFTEYLTNLPKEKCDALQEMYNRKFNCFVKAKYDGSYQTFPGIDLKALASPKFNIKNIYKSQKDCVKMILENGGGICDHEVGTGKSLIMCMAAHEMHRLGLANKPMILAMKANVAEIAATYQAAFPDDKILYAAEKDFTPANRVQFFNRIKNNDYACVIMSHDQFGKIPQAMEIQEQIMQDEIRDIDEALNVFRQQGLRIGGRMLSGLEKRKENMEVKLRELQSDMANRKDDFVDFKRMGIDHLFIDESHQFKNLMFTTRHQRVSGLGNPSGSQKALNLLYAIRTIQERTGKDLGATFLSGTTISNSLTELYLLFKYLRPKAMAKQGIHCFDAWAAVYAKKTSDYEFSVTNAVVQKERFRYFVKVPELATFYNEITDYRTGDDVGLDRPNMNVILHDIEPTADQQDFNERLVKFAQTGEGGLIFRAPLNDREMKGKMLIATDASRKASLDMRLVSPEQFGDDPNNKASHCARLVAEYYKKYDEQKGTQFIFSDLSTYKPNEWNIFQEIKDKLVSDYGIPADEVRFIQEASSNKVKQKMIDLMNEGKIRVLFGSTSTLGTGVNAQQRAVAVHHIDIPWRPSDLEQRNGRARRTGNWVAKEFGGNHVDVIIYAVKRTLDSYKFNLLQNKQLFITQLKTNQLGTRVIDEGAMDEENGMNFAEYVAILSGNDDLLQKAKLEKKILALESERKTFMQARRGTEWRLEEARKQFSMNETIIAGMTEDYGRYQSHVVHGEDGTALPGLVMENISELTADGAYNVEEMGAALQDAGRTIGNKDRQMGTVYGFPLMVNTIYTYDEKLNKDVYAGNKFYVKGNYLYEYNNGKLAMSKDNRLGAVRYGVNALEKISSVIEQYEKRNESLRAVVAEYERIAGKPWGKEEELKGLKKELEALEAKIRESLDETTKNQPREEVKPYKVFKEGRWHKVTFARDAYPFVSIHEMREFAGTFGSHNRGYVYCGHWSGDVMVSDPEVRGEFTSRQQADDFIAKVEQAYNERKENPEWIAAKAKEDTKGDVVYIDNEVIFACRDALRQQGTDWQNIQETPQDVALLPEEVKAAPADVQQPEQDVQLSHADHYDYYRRYIDIFCPGHSDDSVRVLSNALVQITDEFSKLPDWDKRETVLAQMRLKATRAARAHGFGDVKAIADIVMNHVLPSKNIVYSAGQYGGTAEGEELRRLAHQVKDTSSPIHKWAVREISHHLVGIFNNLPSEDIERVVLVPVPDRNGRASYTKDIAVQLSELRSIPVYDNLVCDAHPSLYELKKTGVKVSDLRAPHFEMTDKESLPSNSIVVLVDNVLDTGTTLASAMRTDFGGHVAEVRAVVLAHTDNLYYQELSVKSSAVLRKENAARSQFEKDLRERGYTKARNYILNHLEGRDPLDRDRILANLRGAWTNPFPSLRDKARATLSELGVNWKTGEFVSSAASMAESADREASEPQSTAMEAQKSLEQKTAVMRQWKGLKSKHPESLLLFRTGDFYKAYREDAVKASAALGIPVVYDSGRSVMDGTDYASVSFPQRTLDTYLPKLIRAGHRIAICDQLEEPKSVVRRTATGDAMQGVVEQVEPQFGVRMQIVDNDSFLSVTERDEQLRDTLIQKLRNAGIDVNTDVEEGERILQKETAIIEDKKKIVANRMIAKASSMAERMSYKELTIENWLSEFGENQCLETPIGSVKIGEHQYQKLILNNRTKMEFAMIKRTLESPDFIVEEKDKFYNPSHERPSQYFFIKAFEKDDGTKYYLFKSVTVKKDGMEVNTSNHIERESRVRQSLMEGKLLWKRAEIASDYSDLNQGLYKQPGMVSEPAVQGRVHPQSDFSFTKVQQNFESSKENGENLREERVDSVDENNAGVRYMLVPDSQSPIFISNARIALDKIKQDKATPEQWLKMIEKNGGLKAGEDRWTGLSDWLRSSNERVLIKQQVIDYINENQIQVEEVHYDNVNDLNSSDALKAYQKEFDELKQALLDRREEMKDAAHREYSEYCSAMQEKYGDSWEGFLEPAERVQERALQKRHELYVSGYGTDDDVIAFSEMIIRHSPRSLHWERAFYHENGRLMIDDEYNAVPFLGEVHLINSTRLKFTTKGLDGKREIALVVPTIDNWKRYDIVHFGDAGDGRAVAWIRFGSITTAAGERVLVLDEIQSKRHQEGREQGYRRGIIAERDAVAKVWAASGRTDDAAFQKLQDLNVEIRERKYLADDRPPAAPFEKNWQELAMKRMLRYAAENGYDRVAWTTGMQQAERYSLGGKVDSIYIGHSKGHPENYSICAYDHNANMISSASPNNATEEEVLNLFGKGIGEQLIKGCKDADRQKAQGEMPASRAFVLNGTDLEIGGEGLKAFYDHILPNFVNKYGKQWGVTVEDMELPTIGESMHSIPVTDQMKQDVREGQPMFFRNGERQAYGFVHNGTIYIDPRIATAETPIHEYTHLWAEVLRQRNPQEWQNIVQLMKDTPEVWNHVRQTYPDLRTDDQIADEALAQFSGRRGYKKLQEFAVGKSDADTVFDKMAEALGRFWKGVAEFFGIHYTSKEQVADRILYDLLNEVNPLDFKIADIQGLQEQQEAQIESDNFKQWFGDWQLANTELNVVSKVVDNQGRPLVVEHATNADFTVFDLAHLGDNSKDQGLFGAGFYFGTQTPGWMSGAKHVMRVYLDIKHPFEIDDNVSDMYSELKDKLDTSALRGMIITSTNGRHLAVGEYIDHIKAVDALAAENPELVKEMMAQDGELEFIPSGERARVWREHEIANRTGFLLHLSWQSVITDQIGSEVFSAALKDDGYDGVIVDRGEGYKEYVAFSAAQIKSATDNVGLFNRNNPDIRYHFIGERGARNLDVADGGGMRIFSLRHAERLSSVGRTAESIKTDTGWECGEDGKWRFEIPATVLLDEKALNNQGKDEVVVPLDGLVSRDSALLKAYPELSTYQVRFSNNATGVTSDNLGEGGQNAITIPSTLTLDQQSTALQNGLQNTVNVIEGFALDSIAQQTVSVQETSQETMPYAPVPYLSPRVDIAIDKTFLSTHTADQMTSLVYRAGESYEDYLHRNSLLQGTPDSVYYFHQKYADRWEVIENLLGSGITADNASDVAASACVLADSRSEALSFVQLLNHKDPAAILSFTDAVRQHYDRQDAQSAEHFRPAVVQGLEQYDAAEVEDMVKDHVVGLLTDYFMEEGADIFIKEVTIIGSRSRGEARPDSDLDILLEYGGSDVREDALFNLLNAEPLKINGIAVDINPINPRYSMDTAHWLAQDARWREEDNNKNNIKKQDNMATLDQLQTLLTGLLSVNGRIELPRSIGLDQPMSIGSVDMNVKYFLRADDGFRISDGEYSLPVSSIPDHQIGDFVKLVEEYAANSVGKNLENARSATLSEDGETVSVRLSDDTDEKYTRIPGGMHDDPALIYSNTLVDVFFYDSVEHTIESIDNEVGIDAYENRDGIFLVRSAEYEKAYQQLEEHDRAIAAEESKDKKVDGTAATDYSQYVIPSGVTVANARWQRVPPAAGEQYATYHIMADINGTHYDRVMYGKDIKAFFEKDEYGKKTGRVTLDQLVAKYFGKQFASSMSIGSVQEAEHVLAEQTSAKEQVVIEKAEADRRQQEQEEESRQKEAAKKASAEKARKSKEKKERVPASVIQSGLLLGALLSAKDKDGVWLNASGKATPSLSGNSETVNPFNALMMSLHSDAHGYKTNAYTTFASAKGGGYSVKSGENGLPFFWYSWDKYVNRFNPNDIITKESYDALVPEEQELYKACCKKEECVIFNIDQTTMAETQPAAYQSVLDVQDKDSVYRAIEAQRQSFSDIKSAYDQLLSKYPETVLMYREAGAYTIFGEDAERCSKILELDLEHRDFDGEAVSSVSFPVSTLSIYLTKLIHSDMRAAIIDQLTDPVPGQCRAAADSIYKKAEILEDALLKLDGGKETVMRQYFFTSSYSSKDDTLLFDGSRCSSIGNEIDTALRRVNASFRAAAAYTGAEHRLNRIGRDTLLPRDVRHYDRLVSELAAGFLMSREGLPAMLDKASLSLVPYWERELKENPKMLSQLERDVNNAVGVLDRIKSGEAVDYRAVRGDKPFEAINPKHYTITSRLAAIPDASLGKVVVVKDERNKSAAVLLPQGASMLVRNELPEMKKNHFVIALHKEGYDDVKFYNAGGALGLNQPNEFFADKKVEVSRLKDCRLLVTETIDFSEELARSGKADIDRVQLTFDDEGRSLLYVKPSGEASFTVYPERSDVQLLLRSLRTQDFAAVQEEIGQKYHSLVQRHPDIKANVLMPEVDDIDLSRISKVSIAKDRYRDNTTIIFATIDGECQKPLALSKFQAQRFWLADDKEMYKTALAAQLWQEKLQTHQGQSEDGRHPFLDAGEGSGIDCSPSSVEGSDEDQEEKQEERQERKGGIHV